MVNKVLLSILALILLVNTLYAADLAKFPDMFINDGNADVLVIIGKAAAPEDTLGAIDIVVALQHKSQNKLDIAKLDDEVGSLSAQNTILVGGPCANSAAAKLLNYPKNCLEGFEPGKGYINLYEFDNGNIAMLVAGTLAIDTRRTTRVLANYKEYDLKGTQMVISQVNFNEIKVK